MKEITIILYYYDVDKLFLILYLIFLEAASNIANKSNARHIESYTRY